MNTLLRALSMLALSAALSACGFHLRGDYLLPDQLNNLHVISQQRHAPAERALKARLKSYDVSLLQQRNPDAATIVLMPEQLDRRLLSLFSTGQVAEYELIYSLTYILELPEQDAQQFQVEVLREYQDDPDAVLAKTRELNLILSELRQQAIDKIIRQLASINET